MQHKHRFRQDLQELLTKYQIDKYCDLHSYMLSEHLVRWIEEYARCQNVAQEWGLSSDRQQPYYDYMTKKGAPDGHSQLDSFSTREDPSEK